MADRGTRAAARFMVEKSQSGPAWVLREPCAFVIAQFSETLAAIQIQRPSVHGTALMPDDPTPLPDLESRIAALVDGLRHPRSFAAACHEQFVNSGEEKANKIIEHLRANHPPLNLARCAYFSIGGSDGSEIETVMRKTEIGFGVLLEYESDLIPKISHRRAALADLGKTLKPEIGDAMQRIRRCRDQLLDWRKQEKIDGIICSMQAVLHELPYRSANFQIDAFFGDAFWDFKPCLLYMRASRCTFKCRVVP